MDTNQLGVMKVFVQLLYSGKDDAKQARKLTAKAKKLLRD
jgi:hypothetical protein